ncbi:hypothetical protein DPMN_026441 [Dreissena polymorpha]|uniref:Uncharacterized protein n=1 Tax=Dreissena polymorpha TaxID=45954 RepID=A0A9D4LR46_DREPO|nr:hypothetical protein DPMN_026441 [Dreissena polymorpha]
MLCKRQRSIKSNYSKTDEHNNKLCGAGFGSERQTKRECSVAGTRVIGKERQGRWFPFYRRKHK